MRPYSCTTRALATPCLWRPFASRARILERRNAYLIKLACTVLATSRGSSVSLPCLKHMNTAMGGVHPMAAAGDGAV